MHHRPNTSKKNQVFCIGAFDKIFIVMRQKKYIICDIISTVQGLIIIYNQRVQEIQPVADGRTDGQWSLINKVPFYPRNPKNT